MDKNRPGTRIVGNINNQNNDQEEKVLTNQAASVECNQGGGETPGNLHHDHDDHDDDEHADDDHDDNQDDEHADDVHEDDQDDEHVDDNYHDDDHDDEHRHHPHHDDDNHDEDDGDV